MMHGERMRVVFHGAVILFVGLLCGFAVVPEEEPARLWHTAHESLILIGTLLLAISSVMPVLVLERREARGLRWSLLATGYGFMVALILQALTGVHAFGPSRALVPMIAFAGNAVGIVGSLLAASLTLMGARAARASATRAASAG